MTEVISWTTTRNKQESAVFVLDDMTVVNMTEANPNYANAIAVARGEIDQPDPGATIRRLASTTTYVDPRPHETFGDLMVVLSSHDDHRVIEVVVTGCDQLPDQVARQLAWFATHLPDQPQAWSNRVAAARAIDGMDEGPHKQALWHALGNDTLVCTNDGRTKLYRTKDNHDDLWLRPRPSLGAVEPVMIRLSAIHRLMDAD